MEVWLIYKKLEMFKVYNLMCLGIGRDCYCLLLLLFVVLVQNWNWLGVRFPVNRGIKSQLIVPAFTLTLPNILQINVYFMSGI